MKTDHPLTFQPCAICERRHGAYETRHHRPFVCYVCLNDDNNTDAIMAAAVVAREMGWLP